MDNFKLTQELDGTAQLSLEELVDHVIDWGHARGIIDNSSPQIQALKLGSEFGELCDNLAKGRYEAAMDDIGDCIVVLIMIATQIDSGTNYDSSFTECLRVAYNDIKDRKGYLNQEGIYIKQGDE